MGRKHDWRSAYRPLVWKEEEKTDAEVENWLYLVHRNRVVRGLRVAFPYLTKNQIALTESLGVGSWGEAFLTDRGTTIKITTDEEEFKAAQRVKQSSSPSIVTVFDAQRLGKPADAYYSYYVIHTERLLPTGAALTGRLPEEAKADIRAAARDYRRITGRLCDCHRENFGLSPQGRWVLLDLGPARDPYSEEALWNPARRGSRFPGRSTARSSFPSLGPDPKGSVAGRQEIPMPLFKLDVLSHYLVEKGYRAPLAGTYRTFHFIVAAEDIYDAWDRLGRVWPEGEAKGGEEISLSAAKKLVDKGQAKVVLGSRLSPTWPWRRANANPQYVIGGKSPSAKNVRAHLRKKHGPEWYKIPDVYAAYRQSTGKGARGKSTRRTRTARKSTKSRKSKLDQLAAFLKQDDVVLGESPAGGGPGNYTAYYFESGIPGNPDRDSFWESDPMTGRPLWEDEADSVTIRVKYQVSPRKIADALVGGLGA